MNATYEREHILRDWNMSIDTKNAICPKCGNRNIVIVYHDIGDGAYRYVKCYECGMEGDKIPRGWNNTEPADIGAYKNWLAKSKEYMEKKKEFTKSQKEIHGREILPCPYCLHERIYVITRRYGRRHYCYCHKCRGRGPIVESREKAIMAWNNPYQQRIKPVDMEVGGVE